MDHCTICSKGSFNYNHTYEDGDTIICEWGQAKYCPECGRPLSKILKNQKKSPREIPSGRIDEDVPMVYEFDVVNRPSHYCEGRKYEPIDVIDDWKLGFSLGNALKYISRAGRKDDIIQDLNKAKFYLEHEIKTLEDKRNAR